MKYVKDFDEIQRKFDCFWNGEYAGRALLYADGPYVKGDNVDLFLNDERDMHLRPDDLLKYWLDPETILKKNINRFEKAHFVGEALPIIFQNYGASGLANYLGCTPKFGNDTVWFDAIHEEFDVDLEFNREALDKHLEIAKYLADNANDRYFLGNPDNCGAVDTLCHIFGNENMLMEFYSEEDDLKRHIKKVNEVFKIALDSFYEVGKKANLGGSSHAWMNILSKGKISQLQCDLSVMISNDTFEEFVTPELEEQASYCDNAVYHLDGKDEIRHLDSILGVKKIDAIQWTNCAGQESPVNFIPTFKRIQEAGKGIILMCKPNDVQFLLENLSGTGLYLKTRCQTAEEADDLLKLVEKYSHE